jgi:hypothetical protein
MVGMAMRGNAEPPGRVYIKGYRVARIFLDRDADRVRRNQEIVIFDVLLSGSVMGDIKGTES